MTSFAWDHRNRLTTATFTTNGSVTKQMQYTYDVFNRRIEKQVSQYTNPSLPPAFAERSFYDVRTTAPFVHTTGSAWSSLDDVVLILHGDYQNDQFTALRTRLLSGPDVDQVFADETAQGDLLWTLADNQGTIRDLANTASQVVNHVYYSAFGQPLGETNPGWATVTNQAPPWQKRRELVGPNGRLYDVDLGMSDDRARPRDPSRARFLTRDPLELEGGDPNVYRDRGNSPTNGRDPTGLWNESGHFYTIYVMFRQAGYSHEKALQFAFYAQQPDEIRLYDAAELGKNLVEPKRLSVSINPKDPKYEAAQEEARRRGNGTGSGPDKAAKGKTEFGPFKHPNVQPRPSHNGRGCFSFNAWWLVNAAELQKAAWSSVEALA